jgi:hypothetical protein
VKPKTAEPQKYMPAFGPGSDEEKEDEIDFAVNVLK